MKTYNLIRKVWHIPQLKKAALFAAGLLPDKTYIRLVFKGRVGYSLDLDNPTTFNEKLNWLKLNYHKNIFTKMADKYEAKLIVSDKLGEDYVIPTYGVYKSFDEIDFDTLPNEFMMKVTHDSAGQIVCRDKTKLDKKQARKTIEKALKQNYFLYNREWPYKNIPRRIIVEQFVPQLGNDNSIEYKVSCFNGKVKFVTVCEGPAHEEIERRHNDHFDIDGNRIPFEATFKAAPHVTYPPKCMGELIRLSEILAKDTPYLRVDWYDVNGKLIFGEMTFYTWGGFCMFEPKKYDKILGEWLTLPEPCYEEPQK